VAWPLCISPIAFAGVNVLAPDARADLLSAVGPLEVMLPVTEPDAEGAGLGNVAGGLGACAARGTLLLCTVPAVADVEPTVVLDGRGRVAGMAADVLGVGDIAAFAVVSFLGADVEGTID
jgi:hypothetical protein